SHWCRDGSGATTTLSVRVADKLELPNRAGPANRVVNPAQIFDDHRLHALRALAALVGVLVGASSSPILSAPPGPSPIKASRGREATRDFGDIAILAPRSRRIQWCIVRRGRPILSPGDGAPSAARPSAGERPIWAPKMPYFAT